MEPKLPVPSSLPERSTYNPQELPPRPEVAAQPAVERAPERQASQELAQPGPVQSGPVLPSPTLPPTASATATTPVIAPLPTVDDNPAQANDEDVIEKEWVDKAKQIVRTTKDDPYQQEKQVSKLQADYVKKRYGKDIKLAGD